MDIYLYHLSFIVASFAKFTHANIVLHTLPYLFLQYFEKLSSALKLHCFLQNILCLLTLKIMLCNWAWLLHNRTMNNFRSFVHFFIWFFFNRIFFNLLLKIHIIAPINHFFFVNHCSINMKISKCANFAKFCVSSWKLIIILNCTKIC
jgi:hypothetical protein